MKSLSRNKSMIKRRARKYVDPLLGVTKLVNASVKRMEDEKKIPKATYNRTINNKL